MNVGPSPSRASVEAGAVTQFLVKKLSPTSNRRRSSGVRFGAGKASEFRDSAWRVASPPRSGSGPAAPLPPHDTISAQAATTNADRLIVTPRS